MSTYSVAEARNQLSSLIDLANDGAEVVITRHGHPVAVLKPALREPGPMTDAELASLLSLDLSGPMPSEDAGAAVSRMRDEDWR